MSVVSVLSGASQWQFRAVTPPVIHFNFQETRLGGIINDITLVI